MYLLDSKFTDGDYIYDNMIGISNNELPKRFINNHIYVKDQGSTMMCVGFSTSALIEAIEMKRLGKENVPMLSPQYVYHYAKTLDDMPTIKGTTLKAMADAVKKYGICEATMYNDNHDLISEMTTPNATAIKNAESRKIDGYARVITLDAIKKAIYQDCGVITSILYYGEMLSPKKGYINKPSATSKKLGNHSTYWIGYDDDEKVIVQLNSYGKEQGVFGLEYIPYEMITENWCGGLYGYSIDKLFREAYVFYDNTNIINDKFHIENQPNVVIKKEKSINMEFTMNSNVAMINGEKVAMDVAPLCINGTNFVPFRFIFEAMDCDVAYKKEADGHDSIVGVDRNTAVKVSLNIGYKVAYVNGEQYVMPQAPFIKDGRTYVPLRAIGEMLGAKVLYDGITKKISIRRWCIVDKILFRLSELLKIKSIVTLVCMFVFGYLAITNKLQPSEVMVVVTAVITYFFNKDNSEKKEW